MTYTGPSNNEAPGGVKSGPKRREPRYTRNPRNRTANDDTCVLVGLLVVAFLLLGVLAFGLSIRVIVHKKHHSNHINQRGPVRTGSRINLVEELRKEIEAEREGVLNLLSDIYEKKASELRQYRPR